MATVGTDIKQELASAFEEIEKTLAIKHAHLFHQLDLLVNDKKKLQEKVLTLKRELERNRQAQLPARKHESAKEQKIRQELEWYRQELERYKKELQISQKQNQDYENFCKQLNSTLAKDIDAIKTKEMELNEWEKRLQLLDQELTAKKKINDETSPSSHETKRPIRRRSSSVDGRRRLPKKPQYGVIYPGSITHDTIHQQFIEYYTKHKRQYGSVLNEYNKQYATILCHIMQIAFDYSKNKVIEVIEETLTKKETDSVKKAINLIEKSRLTVSYEPEIAEIHRLFSLPLCAKESTGSPEGWEEKKYAYSILLNSSDINKREICTALEKQVKDEVLKILMTIDDNIHVLDMVEKAAHLSWDMVTLVPPAIVAQPPKYYDEWQEKRYNYWKEENCDQALIYYRPVLFFSALGHVACKGEVGNTLPTELTAADRRRIPPLARPDLRPRNPCVGGLGKSYGMKRNK